jgi:capsid protein
MEARRVIDGDILILRHQTGHVQAIEADRVRGEMPGNKLLNGVWLNEFGGAIGYQIHSRTPGGSMQYECDIDAEHVYHCAYIEDRIDQVRGISPFAAAFNDYIDLREATTYALARMKVEQLFALAITKQGGGMLGEERDDPELSGARQIDLSKGPQLVELEPGESASFLQSGTPSSQFQQFVEAITSSCLKALDIPLSFFRENFTNYSGARQALLQYGESAKVKRQELLDFLSWWTDWKLAYAPKSIRRWVSKIEYEWIHAGMPWIDPKAEMEGYALQVAMGLATRREIAQEHGKDFGTIVQENARDRATLEEYGFELSMDDVAKLMPNGGAGDAKE